MVSREDTGPEVFGWELQKMVAIFYKDDGLLESPLLARIQECLDFLMEPFDRVGLQTNVKNMVGMVCQP